MIGKAMRFATVCTLAFAISGKASRDTVPAVSKGTIEDLEPSKTSSCSRVRRLAVILTAVTSAGAFDFSRPWKKDSYTAYAPILTNNPLGGTHDMLRPANANRANFAPILATPQVFAHDIKLYANRQGEEAQALNNFDTEYQFSPVLALKPLDDPTPADGLAFSRLNKRKDCRPVSKDGNSPGGYFEGYSSITWSKTPQFNVLEEYTRQAELNVAEDLDLGPEEMAALWGYANKDTNIINQIARGADKVVFKDFHYDQGLKTDITCTLTKEDMLPWLKFLNAGLNKMPSAAAGRLYRGVGFNAEGTPGSIAPINGFSSFSEDLNVAQCFVELKRKDGIQPTIFAMDKHSSGRQLDQIGVIRKDHKEVVFPVGTKFVIVEDAQVQREVVALWKKHLKSSTYYDGFQTMRGGVEWSPSMIWPFNKLARPTFKVLVVKEVVG